MEPPRLLVPALGGIYRAVAWITEPLIRVVAGGSLAIHGFPILFGNTAGAAKFLESVGFRKSPVLGLCRGWRGVCVRYLPRYWFSYATGRGADYRLSAHRDRDLPLAIWFRLGKPRHRISSVLGNRGFPFSHTGRWAMFARCTDGT